MLNSVSSIDNDNTWPEDGGNFTANMQKVNDGYPFGYEYAVRAIMDV
jgi:hypothetical protein